MDVDSGNIHANLPNTGSSIIRIEIRITIRQGIQLHGSFSILCHYYKELVELRNVYKKRILLGSVKKC